METVIDELISGKKQGAKFIRMNDEVFPIDQNWIKKFLALYKTKIDLPFFAYIRPEFHSPDIIKEMVTAGLCSTIVGIQAGSQHIRKKVFNRTYPTEKLIEFAETVSGLGIEYSYHLINYNPYEKEFDMEETLQLLRRLPYASLFIFKLVPLKGTPIYQSIKESGVVPLPDNKQKWYGYLYTMTVMSPALRLVATVLHKYKIFCSYPFFLSFFFLPSFIVLHIKKLKRKFFYGSFTLMPIPSKSKNDK